MISFLKLIRYKNLLMVLLTMVLTKYALFHNFIEQLFLTDSLFIIFSLSIISITASGYIVNDIYDLEADKINKPNKVYIENTMSKKNAWISYFIIMIIGLFCGFYVTYLKEDYFLSAVFPITILLLFLYSKYLKRTPLLGNIVVSLVCAIIIYLLYLVDFQEQEKASVFFNIFDISASNSTLFTGVLFYSIFSFLTTLIREIIKDIEDINGDYAMKMRTLPILMGKRRTRNLCLGLVFILLLMLFLFIPYVYDLEMKILSVLLSATVFVVIALVFSLWNAHSTTEFKKASKIMKTIMFLGIISIGLFKIM